MQQRQSIQKSTGLGKYRVGTRELASWGQAKRRQAAVAALRQAIATPPPGYVFPAQPAAAPSYAARQSQLSRIGSSTAEVKCCDTYVAPCSTDLHTIGDVAFAEPATAFNGMTCLNEVTPGSAVYSRIGSKIIIRSVQVSATVVADATTLNTSVRCMLVYDRQPNGVAPGIFDILSALPAPTNNSMYLGINITNKSRFQVIRDQIAEITTGGGSVAVVKWFCKGRWEVEFKNNAGTIGDISTGALYLIAFQSATKHGAGNLNMHDITARIRYYD